MTIELIQINKKELYTNLKYINSLNNANILGIDFTGLCGYDLSEQQKNFYLHKYTNKDTIEIIGLIYCDFLGN